MTIYSTPQEVPTDALHTRTETVEKLAQVVSNFAANLDQAAAHRNPDMHPDAVIRERERLTSTARATAVADADLLAREAHERAVAAEQEATPHRPHQDPNDLAQLARTADAWQFNILPQLESGKTWDRIMSSMGPDDAIAIERFAPAYVRGRAKLPQDANDTLASITAGIFQRHADLAPTPEGREKILAAAKTAQTARTAAMIATHVRAARNRPTLTPAFIALKQAYAQGVQP